jgi:hypothetical protein
MKNLKRASWAKTVQAAARTNALAVSAWFDF